MFKTVLNTVSIFESPLNVGLMISGTSSIFDIIRTGLCLPFYRQRHNQYTNMIFRDHETMCKHKEMTYNDIKHNLKVISRLNTGEKLSVDDLRFYVDNRWFMNVMRQYAHDNKYQTCELLVHTYKQLLKYKRKYNDDFSRDNDLQNCVSKSFNGLKILEKTYNDHVMTQYIQSVVAYAPVSDPLRKT